jgi:autoinducer 2-degrading protein
MIAIFVTIKVKPGKMEEFVEASLGDARGSVGDEPGCYRFDVLQGRAEPNTAYLYEIYQDDAAREQHRTMPHYLKWRESVADLIEGGYEVVEMTTTYPSEDGLKKQKPHLLD